MTSSFSDLVVRLNDSDIVQLGGLEISHVQAGHVLARPER